MTTSAAAVAVTLGLLSLNTRANAETLGSWADNTTLGGKSYIDFTHIENKSGGTNDGTYDEIGVWSQLKF
jgi:hypothetical protein